MAIFKSVVSKKLVFQFKNITEELEEITTQEKEYDEIFSQDFAQELQYINSSAAGSSLMFSSEKHKNDKKILIPSHQSELPLITGGKTIPSIFKKIYKKLITKLHPDKHSTQHKIKYEEKLKHITQIYKNKEWFSLLISAYEEKVEVPYIPVQYQKQLKKEINHIKNKIATIKTKVSWIWSTQIKPNKRAREVLYPSMQIQLDNFTKWKKNN